MGSPVAELQRRMTSSEFAEWLALWRIKAQERQEQEMIERVEARQSARTR